MLRFRWNPYMANPREEISSEFSSEQSDTQYRTHIEQLIELKQCLREIGIHYGDANKLVISYRLDPKIALFTIKTLELPRKIVHLATEAITRISTNKKLPKIPRFPTLRRSPVVGNVFTTVFAVRDPKNSEEIKAAYASAGTNKYFSFHVVANPQNYCLSC